ncbi:MAG TPA: trehalase family glycosidase [Thermotogota bacterium]|nr:trehalase family glycosidase [Thermotogota bacterium]
MEFHFDNWHKTSLDRLERTDKWYLGGGNKLIWAPAFPSYLGHPGLWDNATFYDMKIDPGFTFTVLQNGTPVAFQQLSRTWRPDSLVCQWTSEKLHMREEKVMHPHDFLGERVTLTNRSAEDLKLQLVTWTLQKNLEHDGPESTAYLHTELPCLFFQKALSKGNREPSTLFGALCLEGARSFQVDFSEYTGLIPDWRLTPFYETLEQKGLPNREQTQGIHKRGLLYFGLERPLVVPAYSTISVQLGWAFDTTLEGVKRASDALHSDIVEDSRTNWENYFRDLPAFRCSDPYIDGYYPYRWFGLRLFRMDPKEKTMLFPGITEGLEYFRVFITYSAQCHMLEERWKTDDSIARGSLRNFLQNQREDGSFAGHIFLNGVQQNGFYHADWGRTVRELYHHHPDDAFLEEIYPGLCTYAAYFNRERDREGSGLYDVVDQFETGQEFMSRYIAVDENADRYGWTNSLRLKGVDATVYMYNLKRALAWMAQKLGHPQESESWNTQAAKTKRAILTYMWDPEQQFFFDVDPKGFQRTSPKSAVCFYPYMTDIVDESHLPGLKKWLLDPARFWTEYPVATVSTDDPFYDEFAHWKGKRHNCPWNGRVWPMTNSHLADALGICARRFDDPLLREKTVELVQKFIRMMHFDGDPNKPNCFEHYNPSNGKASTYRGVDDYQHSWVNDLILKYLVGIQAGEQTLLVDPFPFGVPFAVSNLSLRGYKLDIRWTGEEFTVKLDGKTAHTSERLQPFQIPW